MRTTPGSHSERRFFGVIRNGRTLRATGGMTNDANQPAATEAPATTSSPATDDRQKEFTTVRIPGFAASMTAARTTRNALDLRTTKRAAATGAAPQVEPQGAELILTIDC